MSGERTPFWKMLVSGTIAGMANVLVGQPLDTVKVRMQTQSKTNPVFKNSTDCFMKTFKNEGIAGLYKGTVSPLIGSAGLFALCFVSYGFGKRLTNKIVNKDWNDSGTSKLNLFQIFCAGTWAGTLPTMITAPQDRIKVLLQVQIGNEKKYKGVMDCARKVGLRGLYQGTMSTLIRDVPGSGFYYLGYEIFLRLFTPKGKTKDALKGWHYLVAGGMAGIFCWSWMIFPDTIKSRIQAAPQGTYKNFMDALTKTIRADGAGVFFKGLGPILIRSFPANAATFAAYEYAMKACNMLTKKYQKPSKAL